jgi:hypothetical protein
MMILVRIHELGITRNSYESLQLSVPALKQLS